MLDLKRWLPQAFPLKVITGCDAYEQSKGRHSPYLSRWTLLKTKIGSLYLHQFHRSDDDRAMHDHPWAFASLILWPGYIEVTPKGRSRKWPGMLLMRPAAWVHRVELLRTVCPTCRAIMRGPYRGLTAIYPCRSCGNSRRVERPAYSLIWVTKRQREWGFHMPDGWKHWREYFKMQGCDE